METVNNKVTLTGFAGADAIVKTFGKSQKLARVNLAVNEYFKGANGEEVKKTQWFNLLFWNTKANIAEEQIKKGTRFTIEGRLQTNTYDAKDGTKRYTFDIVVNEVMIASTAVLN
jgi:single-strand DNA-binding protein